MSQNNRIIKPIEFAKFNIPQPTEQRMLTDAKFVNYGSDNLYPIFLIDLYNESATHSAIVNSKVNYIIGEGLFTDNGELINIRTNTADTFHEFLNKIILDYILFNYFCVEVIYNALKQPIELHHIPAHKIRCNKSKTKFWFADDWYFKPSLIFDRWKKNSIDTTTKLFFFDGYYPTVNSVYPKPEYAGCIKAISFDKAVSDFNLNNIKNHFSASSLITFFNGSNISEDVKRKIITDIQNTYSGENGAKYILDFQNSNGKSAEVKPLTAGDWDKAFSATMQANSDIIYRGHQVTSPMLFGVKTEGQLGGATELETAYEIFKSTYVKNKRMELLSAFKMLFIENNFIQGNINFRDKPLFKTPLSETLKEKIMTVNELRKEAGLEPLANGDKIIGDNSTVSATTFSSEKSNLISLSDEDFEKIKDLGLLREEFEFINDGEVVFNKEHALQIQLKFEDNQDIANYLIENGTDFKTIKDLKTGIRKDLGIAISADDLRNTLTQLHDAGVIDVTYVNDKIKIQPLKTEQPKSTVQVLYGYEVKAGLGAPIISTTRPFCAKLVTNNRLYSRQDIQTMSDIFGYDIFKHGGGFYHNPQTNETTPYCRHYWKAYSVVKKTN